MLETRLATGKRTWEYSRHTVQQRSLLSQRKKKQRDETKKNKIKNIVKTGMVNVRGQLPATNRQRPFRAIPP